MSIPTPLDWAGANCTDPSVDPNVWLSKAAEQDKTLAAALCNGCPLWDACEADWRAHEAGGKEHRGGVRASKTPAQRAYIHRVEGADRTGRGKGGHKLAPCGTASAWKRHRRKGEPIDEACRIAFNQYEADRRRKPA